MSTEPDIPRKDAPLTGREIAEHLARRGEYRYSRSTGAGGQRRDKVATRVELRIALEATDGLPDPIARRIATGLRLHDGPLTLQSERERHRERNRTIIMDELTERVRVAMKGPPPPRRPTRPTRGSIERRRSTKQQRASIKQMRSTPTSDS